MWAPVLGLTALAGALRFLGLGDVPPGLYHDEAFNGLDALKVLEGSSPIYFAANHGREPFFIYLVAATVGSLGRTPGALRLAAAICGTLTIPATFFMTRAWFNRRTALLSAAVLATNLWHIQLSRVGFRAVTLPLAIAVLLWSGGRAVRSRRSGAWFLTGILYGLSFYTYTAARTTPLALFSLAVYLLVVGEVDQVWPGVLHLAVGTLVALAPLGIYTIHHWDVVMGRPAQVSVLSSSVNQGDLWGTLGQQVVRTAGMFFVKGDTIARHNAPGRPVFTPLMGVPFMVGTVSAAVRARRREIAPALMLIWSGAMTVPTLAAADAPHFLRAVGVLPPLAVIPALGLDEAWQAAARLGRHRWGSIALCMVLALSLGVTARDYFVQYGASPEARYAFEAAAAELAAEVNRFTGTGWDGEGMAIRGKPDSGDRHVHLDARLWQAWRGLAFLVPEQESLLRFQPDSPPPVEPDRETLLFLWPYDDLKPYLAELPRPVRIAPRTGPLTRGDLEEKAYPAYASYHIQPMEEHTPTTLARFGDAIELTDVSVERSDREWRVNLAWSAATAPDTDYTAVVYACDGRCSQATAQDDAQPGGRYYPTHWWRPGDVVVDVRALKLPAEELRTPKLAVGLYAWPSLERLSVTSPSGPARADAFILPLVD